MDRIEDERLSAEGFLAQEGYADSRLHSAPAIARLMQKYADYQAEQQRALTERLKAPVTAMEWSLHCKRDKDGMVLASNGIDVANAILRDRSSEVQEAIRALAKPVSDKEQP